MKGYPKHLNSKADIEYVRKHFPVGKFLPELKGMLATYRDWFYVGPVDGAEGGITDEAHKVVREGEEDAPVYSQYELRANPTARIFRLGYTVEEVEAMVAEAEKKEELAQ